MSRSYFCQATGVIRLVRFRLKTFFQVRAFRTFLSGGTGGKHGAFFLFTWWSFLQPLSSFRTNSQIWSRTPLIRLSVPRARSKSQLASSELFSSRANIALSDVFTILDIFPSHFGCRDPVNPNMLDPISRFFEKKAFSVSILRWAGCTKSASHCLVHSEIA